MGEEGRMMRQRRRQGSEVQEVRERPPWGLNLLLSVKAKGAAKRRPLGDDSTCGEGAGASLLLSLWS